MIIIDDELKKIIKSFCDINKIPEKGECIIYVLKLEGDSYYIGQTKNFLKRMYDHFKGNKRAAKWTKTCNGQAFL